MIPQRRVARVHRYPSSGWACPLRPPTRFSIQQVRARRGAARPRLRPRAHHVGGVREERDKREKEASRAIDRWGVFFRNNGYMAGRKESGEFEGEISDRRIVYAKVFCPASFQMSQSRNCGTGREKEEENATQAVPTRATARAPYPGLGRTGLCGYCSQTVEICSEGVGRWSGQRGKRTLCGGSVAYLSLSELSLLFDTRRGALSKATYS